MRFREHWSPDAILASQIPAVTVSILEVNPLRQKLAHRLGFEDPLNNPGRHDFDIAINTSGTSEGLQLCIDMTAREGIIMEMSWYGDHETRLHLGGSFHTGRKRIVSSQVSSISPGRGVHFDLNDGNRLFSGYWKTIYSTNCRAIPCRMSSYRNYLQDPAWNILVFALS